MTALGKMPKNDPKMAKVGFSGYNFGTEGPRDLKFGLLASPWDALPGTRTISDILDFGDCKNSPGYLSSALKEGEVGSFWQENFKKLYDDVIVST